MKSQVETDNEILADAASSNNEISEVRVRHTSSVHPKDCACDICKPLRFSGAIGEQTENEIKEELEYLDETRED